ncbi:acetyl-CoA synthetase-like protein [Pseudovirgaria hyperparasitica]|uniref:Acetyl-CoA synthetase-like protein n=1 Tax=Pseudovirgaria hyperparasitica TaxID=470096 RepID=A0A6A6VTQ1_9PEZI|nr:acetyl-CoA synthetase-like protein [Pseudovirgaria hyperparasitica]KAF2753104.1 acetyl-CoA synthetase-like protein [Pseudovirgaria hyperparasitica]
MSTSEEESTRQRAFQSRLPSLSIVHGPSSPPLVTLTLGGLLDLQVSKYGPRECLVVPWTGARWTYNQLRDQTILIANSLLDMGIRPGDKIGVMAGNCEQFVSLFFATTRIGAIIVLLNNTYTAEEAQNTLQYTQCRLLFTTLRIGTLSQEPLLRALSTLPERTPVLEEIILLTGPSTTHRTYTELVSHSSRSLSQLTSLEKQISTHSVCNMQFTSGSTGGPKAAMLTHHNLINNARFIGDRMALTALDVLCCPPPLFHCFGLVLGLLAAITHGGKIVYPAETFSAQATLAALVAESCTALHGVPAMIDSLFALPQPPSFRAQLSLRTGIIAGAPVPKALMHKMVHDWGMTQFTSSYGLTEASPTVFNASTTLPTALKLATVGSVMPHCSVKLISRSGRPVPRGVRGELCVAGYQLCSGYFNNAQKTQEAFRLDGDGVLWLHTGDEAVLTDDGLCAITGRFKDIIIRGGENIYPLEIEERLSAHPSVARAVVTGINHEHYGEVVGAFLELEEGAQRPEDEEVREWTRAVLGRHKAPRHVFWLGMNGIPDTVPITGSGKVRKFELRQAGEEALSRTNEVEDVKTTEGADRARL